MDPVRAEADSTNKRDDKFATTNWSAVLEAAEVTSPRAKIAMAGFRVEWCTLPGLTYRLLSTTNLPAAAWSPVGSDMTAVGVSTNRLDVSANAASQGFYRVLLIE